MRRGALALVAASRWWRSPAATSVDDESSRPARARSSSTRVDVVEGIGEKGGFDAEGSTAARARRRHRHLDLLGRHLAQRGRRRGRPGLRLRDRRRGLHRHERARRDSASAPKVERAKQVFVEFSDGNRVPARDHRRRPERRRRAAQGRPEGPQAHAALARAVARTSRSARRSRRSAARSASGSRSRSASSPRSTATSSRSPTSASATRSRPTPPSTPATPAARCSNAQGRVIGINSQIKSSVRRRRGRRLRGAGRHGQALAAPAARQGPRRLRLPRRERLAAVPAAGAQARTCRSRARGAGGTVEKGSPADKAGLEAGKGKIDFQGQQDIPAGGDVIIAVDGQQLDRAARPQGRDQRDGPGETVTLEVLRDGERRRDRHAGPPADSDETSELVSRQECTGTRRPRRTTARDRQPRRLSRRFPPSPSTWCSRGWRWRPSAGSRRCRPRRSAT